MRQKPNVLLIGDDDARMAKWRETFERSARVAQAEDAALLGQGVVED